MYRIATEKLLKWKESKRRKPLIVEGARQVGKTWLMKEFGKQAYADMIYINFDSDSGMAKLFVADVGLLGCMAGLRQRTLLDGNDLFTEFKGALTEQYVCQQLKTIEDLGIYYYTNDRGSCEVDFVVDTGELVIPVEVKAEVNLKAKSLKTCREKFSPEVSVRTSMSDYKREDWLINLPLYAIEQIAAI